MPEPVLDASLAPRGRAGELVMALGLTPHPEGGFFRELFRSPRPVDPLDGRPQRPALTSIDFLLARGQFSAWHRVRSDEAWHLLEGGPMRLWWLAADLSRLEGCEVGPVDADHPGRAPRHVVPAGAWQAAEPLGDFAYCGATVGPGFDFNDFAFGRDDVDLRDGLARHAPELRRLL
jgi:predicted cupin superfamily sugar epimerase